MNKKLQNRINALAKRLCLENLPKGGRYHLARTHDKHFGIKWWLCGDATGDTPLPGTSLARTEEEAVEAVFLWLNDDKQKMARDVEELLKELPIRYPATPYQIALIKAVEDGLIASIKIRIE